MNTTRRTGVGSSGYLSEIPHSVQYVLPLDRPAVSTTSTLPLGILVLIFSHLEDVSDIARVTRTSRLFKYVALPQLYEKVLLQPRAEIKYVDGRPQGFGGGSPFAMALNGLATQDYVTYVKELKIKGELEVSSDFAKGRVPDSTMMLNTILRLIVGRANRLNSFVWELSAKPTKTFYQGLAASQTLTKLTLRFPTSRVPQPTAVIPRMPKLRLLKVINIDPMCYPDDLSLVVLHSPLEDVRLHFSPRMRSQSEPMMALTDIFRGCLKAGYLPKFKHFAVQNYFGRYFEEMSQLFDPATTKSISFLDMFGGSRTSGSNVFIDDSWKDLPPELVNTFSVVRFNEPASQHVKMLQNATQTLEKIYCVNELEKPDHALATPGTTPGSDQNAAILGREYLHVLTRKHGSSLRHLLLCNEWIVSQQEIGDIIRLCPNLEQLAVALDTTAFDIFRIIMQFLPKVIAVRVFDNDWLRNVRAETTLEHRMIMMGTDLYNYDLHDLRYVGVGPEAFRINGKKQIILPDFTERTVVNLEYVSPADLQHIAIWGMDKMDIMAEPSCVK